MLPINRNMIERVGEVPSKKDLNKIFTESMVQLSQAGRTDEMGQVFDQYVDECDKRYFDKIKTELEDRDIAYAETEDDIVFEVGEHEYQITNSPEDPIITAVAIHKDTSYEKRLEVTEKEDELFMNEDNDYRVLGFSLDYQKNDERFGETAQEFVDELLTAYSY